MADLAAVTAVVRPVQVIEMASGPASEVITAGAVVGYVAATGQWCLADADTGPIVAKGIALNDANQAGISLDVLKKGIVDVGSILDGLDHGALVYPSGTAGRLADAIVNAQPALGEVVPGWGTTTADKLLRVNL
jgi:hypothetical protein